MDLSLSFHAYVFIFAPWLRLLRDLFRRITPTFVSVRTGCAGSAQEREKRKRGRASLTAAAAVEREAGVLPALLFLNSQGGWWRRGNEGVIPSSGGVLFPAIFQMQCGKPLSYLSERRGEEEEMTQRKKNRKEKERRESDQCTHVGWLAREK